MNLLSATSCPTTSVSPDREYRHLNSEGSLSRSSQKDSLIRSGTAMSTLFTSPMDCGPVNDLKRLGGRLDIDNSRLYDRSVVDGGTSASGSRPQGAQVSLSETWDDNFPRIPILSCDSPFGLCLPRMQDSPFDRPKRHEPSSLRPGLLALWDIRRPPAVPLGRTRSSKTTPNTSQNYKTVENLETLEHFHLAYTQHTGTPLAVRFLKSYVRLSISLQARTVGSMNSRRRHPSRQHPCLMALQRRLPRCKSRYSITLLTRTFQHSSIINNNLPGCPPFSSPSFPRMEGYSGLPH